MDKITFVTGPRSNVAIWSNEYAYALNLLYIIIFLSFENSSCLCRNFYKL